jgi:hypothetical protein
MLRGLSYNCVLREMRLCGVRDWRQGQDFYLPFTRCQPPQILSALKKLQKCSRNAAFNSQLDPQTTPPHDLSTSCTQTSTYDTVADSKLNTLQWLRAKVQVLL